MSNDSTIRTFLAIDIDQLCREYIGRVVSELQLSRADVSWVKPGNAHLTLKFLGDISSGTQTLIQEALKNIFMNQEPFDLILSGVGVFPSFEKPRIVWVGIEDKSRTLAGLFELLEPIFESFGFPLDKRRFNPHLTLGRVRSGSGRQALNQAIHDRLNYRGSLFHVDHATLYRSDLKPSGAVYTKLFHFPFSRKQT